MVLNQYVHCVGEMQIGSLPSYAPDMSPVSPPLVNSAFLTVLRCLITSCPHSVTMSHRKLYHIAVLIVYSPYWFVFERFS